MVVMSVMSVTQAGAQTTARSAAAGGRAYSTTRDYVIRFYPRFLTYFQQSLGAGNRLTGPLGMGPKYGFVVAINYDTIYAQFFLDLSQGPQIFTIPKPGTTYSLLTLDVWGNVFQTSIPSQGSGTFALVPRGYAGPLPPNTTRVEVPYRETVWIIRADKYSSSGQNLINAARSFRSGLRLASLQDYMQNPRTGRPTLLPLRILAPRMKAIADAQATTAPTSFLRYLQQALSDPTTQPLSTSDQRLSRAFTRVFAAARRAAARGNYGPISQIAEATRDAHALIVDHWLSHVDSNRWIYFDNVGAWGNAYLDRASLSEYIQYGNNAAAAKYYDAFTDHNGIPLNGKVINSYQLTFSKSEIPNATRFWSLTTYIGPGVELFPNRARKYLVGSYTPGLKKKPDGSITIYISPRPPLHAPRANWLPVPKGPFSVLLRVYGPTGNTSGTYHPPPIKAYGQF
jgi:hypothetical protein